MDKFTQLTVKERGQFLFTYPETAEKSSVAIKLAKKVSDRELVAIIQVLDAAGADISSRTKGLSYSKALDAWFRYVPPAEAFEFIFIADLKFPAPASWLSVRLINWNTRHALNVGKDAAAVCIFPMNSSSGANTSILFANGGQVLGG